MLTTLIVCAFFGIFTDIGRKNEIRKFITQKGTLGVILLMIIYETVNSERKIRITASISFVAMLLGLVMASYKITGGLILFLLSMFVLTISLTVGALLKTERKYISVFSSLLVLTESIGAAMKIFHFPGAAILMILELPIMILILISVIHELISKRQTA